MTISGGVVQVTQQLQVGTLVNSTGTVNVAGGELDVTNTSNATILGLNGTGQIVVSSGGTLNIPTIWTGGFSGAAGILTVTGGFVNVTGFNSGVGLYLGNGNGVTGIVAVSSGTLGADTIWMGGLNSVGTLTISSGSVAAGTSHPRYGTILLVGEKSGSTGTVWVTGGSLDAFYASVGDVGYGSMFVSSNAYFTAGGLVVGNQSGALGLASFQGGTFFGPTARQLGSLQIGVAAGSTWTV